MEEIIWSIFEHYKVTYETSYDKMHNRTGRYKQSSKQMKKQSDQIFTHFHLGPYALLLLGSVD